MKVFVVGRDTVLGDDGVIIMKHGVTRRRLDAALRDDSRQNDGPDVVAAKDHVEVGRTKRARPPFLNNDIVRPDARLGEDFGAPGSRHRTSFAWIHALLVDHESEERTRHDAIVWKALIL